MMTSRRNSLAAVAAVTLIALAGCSPSSGPSSDGLKEGDTLRVGINAAYPPFESVEDGKIVGYDPDIIDEIVAELNVKKEVTDGQLSGLIPALQADQFDALISAITVTEDRAPQVLFTQPYGEATMSLLVSEERSDVTTPEDTLKLSIATQAGSSGQTAVDSWAAEGRTFADVSYFQDMTEAYAAVLAGRADAVLDTVPAELVFSGQNPGYKVVDGFGPKAYFAIAVKKGNSALCQQIDAVLTKLKASGELEKIQTEWFGKPFTNLPDAPPDFATHC